MFTSDADQGQRTAKDMKSSNGLKRIIKIKTETAGKLEMMISVDGWCFRRDQCVLWSLAEQKKEDPTAPARAAAASSQSQSVGASESCATHGAILSSRNPSQAVFHRKYEDLLFLTAGFYLSSLSFIRISCSNRPSTGDEVHRFVRRRCLVDLLLLRAAVVC